MPELPEVETARRLLSTWIKGGTIVSARIVDGRNVFVVARGAPRAFGSALRGRKVRDVERKGKWLRIDVGPELYLFSHLGMTGRWSVSETDAMSVEPWERARLVVARRGEQRVVRYLDPRRFGRLVLAVDDIDAYRALGTDPLTEGIDPTTFADRLRCARRTIKEVLLDQTLLAGVGNIQANEALWKARIDPRRRADALSRADVRRLSNGLRWTLERTLRALADDPRYVSDAGGHDPFKVYGHAGVRCPRGDGSIVRITLGGRGTFFCPACQRG